MRFFTFDLPYSNLDYTRLRFDLIQVTKEISSFALKIIPAHPPFFRDM